MIEIICKDEPEKAIQNKDEEKVFLPKNIRQVGSPRGRHRIYLEDYVYTYLRSVAKNNEMCAGVFLGKSRVVKDIRYTFVSGVVECSAAVFQWENISLDESFWDYIYKEQKQYFSELEIVGWVLGKAGQAMELSPAVEAAHRKYFAGRDKILMLIDILEGDELFFIYEQGYLQKREGYYIYYEKNLAMQEYMIYKREEEMRLAELKFSESEEEDIVEESAESDAEEFSEEVDEPEEEPEIKIQQWEDAQPIPKEPKTQAEEALETYRQMLLERQGKREERQNRRFLYTASSFFLVVLCVIGITTINNYRKMQEVEDVLNIMNRSEDQPSSSEGTDLPEGSAASGEGNPLVVETIESQIEPLDAAEGQDEQKEGSKEDADSEKRDGSKQDSQKQDESKKPADAEKTSDADNQNDAGNTSDADNQYDVGKASDADNQDDAGKASDADSQNDVGNQDEAQQTAAVEQDGEKKYYTVQAGDTLNSICLKIYQSKDMVQQLKDINGIEDGDKILVGQKLLLP